MSTINKKMKKEINPAIMVCLCLAIVTIVSYGLNIFKNNFESNQVVSAETLNPLVNIQQNQRSLRINDGYLTVNSY